MLNSQHTVPCKLVIPRVVLVEAMGVGDADVLLRSDICSQ